MAAYIASFTGRQNEVVDCDVRPGSLHVELLKELARRVSERTYARAHQGVAGNADDGKGPQTPATNRAARGGKELLITNLAPGQQPLRCGLHSGLEDACISPCGDRELCRRSGVLARRKCWPVERLMAMLGQRTENPPAVPGGSIRATYRQITARDWEPPGPAKAKISDDDEARIKLVRGTLTIVGWANSQSRQRQPGPTARSISMVRRLRQGSVKRRTKIRHWDDRDTASRVSRGRPDDRAGAGNPHARFDERGTGNVGSRTEDRSESAEHRRLPRQPQDSTTNKCISVFARGSRSARHSRRGGEKRPWRGRSVAFIESRTDHDARRLTQQALNGRFRPIKRSRASIARDAGGRHSAGMPHPGRCERSCRIGRFGWRDSRQSRQRSAVPL